MIRGRARYRLLGFLLLLLGACGMDQPTGYRDTSFPMGATTRFDALAFTGTWIVVASFPPRKRSPIVVTPAPEVAHLRITSNELPEIAGLYREGSVGELIPVTPGRENLIVMWVDEGFRTAAIGTINGSFGAVLNRSAEVPDDRARAARDVFEFYGWDVSLLKRTIE